MRFTAVSEEVLYSAEAVTIVGADDIAELKAMAARTRRRRIRLCAHPGTGDALHEMIIVHHRDAYVPPHKHPGKSESFHVIDGSLTVHILDDAGTVAQAIEMAAPGGGRPFFYRLSAGLYHTIVPTSEWVVFHEVTNGPFRREDTVFAPWAPPESADAEEHAAFRRRLERRS